MLKAVSEAAPFFRYLTEQNPRLVVWNNRPEPLDGLQFDAPILGIMSDMS